ncbi:MAG: cobalamin-binding protein, partial [Pyrinomonadaceae bacterium]
CRQRWNQLPILVWFIYKATIFGMTWCLLLTRATTTSSKERIFVGAALRGRPCDEEVLKVAESLLIKDWPTHSARAPHQGGGHGVPPHNKPEMSDGKRIVSCLPSATEIACALGLSEQLVGITHECDYPAEIRGKPVVVSNALPIEKMSQSEIDAAVRQRLREGLSLYQVDEKLLRQLAPDLILTQNLCQVCAPSGNEVSQALNLLSRRPEVLWLTPQSLADIETNIRDLGAATGRVEAAEQIIAVGRARVKKLQAMMGKLASHPRVFCMEWLDPVYCSGHWVPEMVKIAGGIDELSQEGKDSVRIEWSRVLDWQPEVLVIMPCGYDLKRVIEESRRLQSYPGWSRLPAVLNRRVYAVDANSYFARPGPRVVEGTELLAHLIHPDLFSWEGNETAYRRLDC